MKTQVDPDHYITNEYFSRERFDSYLYQIDEIIKLHPESVLEIGIGNGFVANQLKSRGVNLTTIDIDAKLKPNKIGSILSLPFANNSFDIVVCFQVLEHLPYSDFSKSLFEIFRVSKRFAVISLPDIERCYRLQFSGNSVINLKKYLEIPRLKKPIHKFDGEHYWEIGKDNYPLSKICSTINIAGLKIERTYRIFENTYHRVFVLSKEETNKSMVLLWNKWRLGNLETWREFYSEENFTLGTIFKIIKNLIKKR